MSISAVEVTGSKTHAVEVIDSRPAFTVEIGVNPSSSVVEVDGAPIAAQSPTSVVEVTAPTDTLVEVTTVTSSTDLVEIGVTGPRGEQGPPGPPGPEAQEYFEVFSFATPSTLWQITHNQGTYAIHVDVFDANGDPILAYVRYPDPNRVEIDWYYPTAGEARLFT